MSPVGASGPRFPFGENQGSSFATARPFSGKKGIGMHLNGTWLHLLPLNGENPPACAGHFFLQSAGIALSDHSNPFDFMVQFREPTPKIGL